MGEILARGQGEEGSGATVSGCLQEGPHRSHHSHWARIARTWHMVVPVAPTFNFTDLLSWSVLDPLMTISNYLLPESHI